MERKTEPLASDLASELTRIAEALERLGPKEAGNVDWQSAPAYIFDGTSARAIARIEAPALGLLRGIDKQKAAVVSNVERLAQGYAAHDMLLWGARGMGKSALLRSAVAHAQNGDPSTLALVQITSQAHSALPQLFAQLRDEKRNFLLFIDDLGFGEDGGEAARLLRSWLEGGVEARPAHIRLAITSNRRAIVARKSAEQDDPINPRDMVDDQLALADRFGLSLGFHVASQDEYLAMIEGYAKEFGLNFERNEALNWSKRRGARSGRIAWHYITELAGRAGKTLG